MGKNKDKKDRYEHMDFDNLLDKSTARPTTKSPRYQRPEPVVPEEAKTLCSFFRAQIEEFISDSNKTDTNSVDRKLFQLSKQGVSIEGVSDCAVYVLDRSVRRDRTSGELIRASMGAVAIKDGVPVFYVSGYITGQLIASLQVVPFGERGPVYPNAAKWSNRV